MEQEKETTGSFTAFRDSMVADYEEAKKRWVEYSDETEKFPEGAEKMQRIRENIRLYDIADAIEKEIHVLECSHVDRQLSKVLPAMGVKHWNSILQSSRAWKEAELARLEDLRKQGVSYKERMNQINAARLKRILAVDKGDITLHDIELRPVEGWLWPIKGYNKLKEVGVTKFVESNFSFMFNVKK